MGLRTGTPSVCIYLWVSLLSTAVVLSFFSFFCEGPDLSMNPTPNYRRTAAARLSGNRDSPENEKKKMSMVWHRVFERDIWSTSLTPCTALQQTVDERGRVVMYVPEVVASRGQESSTEVNWGRQTSTNLESSWALCVRAYYHGWETMTTLHACMDSTCDVLCRKY